MLLFFIELLQATRYIINAFFLSHKRTDHLYNANCKTVTPPGRLLHKHRVLMHMQGPDPAITSRKRGVNGRNNRATFPSGGQRHSTYRIQRFLDGK